MKKLKRIISKIKYLFNPNIKIKLRTILDSKTFLEGGNVISKDVDISSTKVGYGTYIGKESYLVHSKIGKFCSIAPNVKVCIGSHPTRNFVSIHPSFYSTRKQSGFTFVNRDKFKEFKKADDSNIVVIGNDVWIGSNVLVLEGVTIGDGAIIGAGSVVSKDIEPYSINVGNPIQILRYRFTQEQIDFLLKFKWWDRDLKWLKENTENFENIDNFINQVKN